MQYLFYDTCALLDQGRLILDNAKECFYISSLTLKELEHIKTSSIRDQEIKYKARRLINLLSENEDKYKLVTYLNSWDNDLICYPVLSDNNDSRIILSALKLQEEIGEKVTFFTQDYYCKKIAGSVGLNVDYIAEELVPYFGWIEVKAKDDIELASLYNQIYQTESKNPFGLITNQYLLLKDSTDGIIDCYKYDGENYLRVPDYYVFESKHFGKIKPKDPYQRIAMDSLSKNKLTLLRGPAGSGKSYLSLAFLLSQFERGAIDHIIIFCNTVAANGAARLGFYPGSKDDKLLDSQIGNFLASKLGDKVAVEQFINNGTIQLLPMADIRGFDTTGMKAGIYITEAQNMDIELIRLALQRVGDDCVCILDGDSEAQVDLSLYAGSNNGLRRVSRVFRGEDIYGEVTLPNIYRSKIADIAQRL